MEEEVHFRVEWPISPGMISSYQIPTTTSTLCLIFMILVSLENVKKYSHVVAWLPQRLKSTLFEIFSNGGCPKGTRSVEKISNNVDFSLWGNRATTWEYLLTFSSETKIMKIRHSELLLLLLGFWDGNFHFYGAIQNDTSGSF